MVAEKSAARRWTEAEFYVARDAAPAGERWELVDGEVLVTPSPHWRHQAVMVPLLFRIREYVRAQAVGRVFFAPLDVKLEPGMVTQPDLLVVPNGHLDDEIYFVSRLLLAVEVLSPGSARFDRVIKRPRYQRNRVPEYWVVDRESRTFERWQPDDERPAILSDMLVWHPEGALIPLELD
ncbi:MAG: Uma2 family endonuclease, partial [Gemmatimonadaceae bacterium]